MSSIQDLPKEILLPIFAHYAETESQFDLIYNVSHVCRDWKDLCMAKSLWRTFDGTLPLPFLKLLCRKGCLDKTQHVKFSYKNTLLSKEEIKFIYQNLPSLKSINFSNASWMLSFSPCQILRRLSRCCPELCEIVLMDKSLKDQPRVCMPSLVYCLAVRGNTLTSLDLSNTRIMSKESIFFTLGSTCPNLEELKVRNVRNLKGIYFPIVTMQRCFKKLKVLELGKQIPSRGISDTAPGFLNLKTFAHRSVTDDALRDFLLKSPELKSLDITRCRVESHFTLTNLPAENLEKLHVSNTKVYQKREFRDVLTKWSHSLVDLDLSDMRKHCIDTLLRSVVSIGGLRNLETLHIKNTAVRISTVIYVISECSRLKLIDLTGCEEIDKDRRRVYHGRAEMERLKDEALGIN